MEFEITRRGTEIYHLTTDKERSRQQIESMTEFIKKLAISNIRKEENKDANENLLHAIEIFAGKLRGIDATSKRLVHHDTTARFPENINLVTDAEAARSMSVEAFPPHKVIKKRYKQSKSKKKFKNSTKQLNGSPISKDQLRLLHDAKLISKITKEAGKDNILLVTSSKKLKKTKKRKSSSKSRRKRAKKKVSPFRTEDIFLTYGSNEDTSQEIVATYHKKKGPSYSQLQKKKKKGKKTERKQHFYEKVLAKNEDKANGNGHTYTGQLYEEVALEGTRNSSLDQHSHYPTTTQGMPLNMTSPGPLNGRNYGNLSGKSQEYIGDIYSTFQPGEINTSPNKMEPQSVSSAQLLNQYIHMA